MNKIHQIPIFANLSEDQAVRLEQRCRWRNFDADSAVVSYEDSSSCVWFLIKGHARVQLKTDNGKELVLCDMKPGDTFGEMSALDGEARSANITTLEDSELCLMNASDFRCAATEIPEVATALFAIFTTRLRAMNMHVHRHAFMTNRQRLCAELMRMAKPRMSNPQQRIISPPPPHQELAKKLGLMREAITREMSYLRKNGFLENSKGGCIIPDPRKLNQLISG